MNIFTASKKVEIHLHLKGVAEPRFARRSNINNKRTPKKKGTIWKILL